MAAAWARRIDREWEQRLVDRGDHVGIGDRVAGADAGHALGLGERASDHHVGIARDEVAHRVAERWVEELAVGLIDHDDRRR